MTAWAMARKVVDPVYYRFSWMDSINPDRCWLSPRTYRVVKRVLDLLVVALLLPIVLPVLGVCAALIKLESPRDPILYIQKRTGKGGHPFRAVKFRTMVPNADQMKGELAHLSKLQWPDFKIEDDPRTTRVGRFLRTWSLDELPQLYNVVRGEMSLVGPRPTSFLTDQYVLWQTQRLDVAPGITGLWQIMARAEIEFYERSRLDILYVENQCMRLDLEILLRTIPAVLKRRGAH